MIGLLLTLVRFFAVYATASTEKCVSQPDDIKKDTVTSYVRQNLKTDELSPCKEGRQTLRYRGIDTAYTVPCSSPALDFLKTRLCFLFSASRDTVLLLALQLVCIIGTGVLFIAKVSDTKRLVFVGLQTLVPPSADPTTTSIFVGTSLISLIGVLLVADKGTPAQLSTVPVELHGRVRDVQGRPQGH